MFGEKFNAGLGKFVRQSFTIVVYINVNFFLRNDRSGVHTLIHGHQGNAGLDVLVFDCLANTESTTVFGEKGKMKIESVDGRGGQPSFGDDLAIADDEKNIGF